MVSRSPFDRRRFASSPQTLRARDSKWLEDDPAARRTAAALHIWALTLEAHDGDQVARGLDKKKKSHGGSDQTNDFATVSTLRFYFLGFS
jgi:hypothetical protein